MESNHFQYPIYLSSGALVVSIHSSIDLHGDIVFDGNSAGQNGGERRQDFHRLIPELRLFGHMKCSLKIIQGVYHQNVLR